MSDKKYVISSTPHIRSSASIESVMRDVVIGLVPACLAAIVIFGMRAALVLILSVASCIFFEWAFQKITKQTVTITDYSAVVTGLLLAMNLPASVPFWMPIVGSLVAIVIVKQLFGGLGQNFMNPALAARAFLQTAYPTQMVSWVPPLGRFINAEGNSIAFAKIIHVDSITAATPLGQLKLEGLIPNTTHYINAAFGTIEGSLGETCAIALIIGGVYMIIRKVISWRTPVSYILTFAILSFIFGRHGLFTGYPIYELLVGGIMLGAFFMATDYSSSPITPPGQIVMGVGCGLLTFVIRTYGGYPEGVCYSILLMNLAVPLIDRYVRRRVYGVQKKGVAKNA